RPIRQKSRNRGFLAHAGEIGVIHRQGFEFENRVSTCLHAAVECSKTRQYSPHPLRTCASRSIRRKRLVPFPGADAIGVGSSASGISTVPLRMITCPVLAQCATACRTGASESSSAEISPQVVQTALITSLGDVKFDILIAWSTT